MTKRDVSVLIYLPAGARAALGEERLRGLADAHPRAAVAQVDSAERFVALLPGADAALVWPGAGPLPVAVLQPGGRLRWVHSLPAGVDWLLTPELRAAGHVTLSASKGPMGPLMAEHALMLMLALARGLPGHLRDQAERRWRPLGDERPMADASGKTVLILGVGAVGGHLAQMCRAGLGMRVLGLARTRRDHPHVDQYVERGALHAALGEADFVALCLALTGETRGIIDAAALAALRPTAYLVNVVRGGLVDEGALAEALAAGRLAGAGLDATAVEPLPQDSPLWGLPNVIITPHVAPGRDRVGGALVAFWRENIRRFAAGEPLLGVVDREAGY